MRLVRLVTMISLVTVTMSVMAPTNAEALFRLGVEARWVPLAEETMEEGGESFSPDRQLHSTGLGVRALLGFEYFSVGGKINFTHHTFERGDLNYTQLDVNAHIRSGMPLTRLAFFVEAGPSVSLDIGDLGFNAAVGAEVDILGWPHVDLNLGIAAQYADVSVGAGPGEKRRNHGVRGLLVLGFDFALHDGS